jgi:uncharacterized protein (DUF1697 family)
MTANAISKKTERTAYVAFLRGINVGGRSLIPMAALKKILEEMGFKDVRTLLASGNVVFASEKTDIKGLSAEIGAGLKQILKKDVGVLLRRLDDLEKVRSTDPFKGIAMTPGIRLYVTFLADKAVPRALALPYASPRKEFRILAATRSEVFSVVDLASGKGTPELMAIIEKEFGSNVTTRNWNTVLKVLR